MSKNTMVIVAIAVVLTLVLRDKLTGLPGVNKLPTV